MMIPKNDLCRGLSAVLFAAHTNEEEHPTLCSVQFWSRGDKLCMGATNGWWAGVVTLIVPDADSDAPRFAVKRSSINLLCAILDADVDSNDLEIEMDEDELHVRGTTWRVDFPHTVEIGPDLESLVHCEGGKGLTSIAIAPDLLTTIRKAFKAAGDVAKGDAVELSFGQTGQSPILITCPNSPDLAVVLMPCSIGQPVECDEVDDGRTRKTIRRDTGETLHEEPVNRQIPIPGTASNPLAESVAKFQKLADDSGMTLSVAVNGGEEKVIARPAKRGKKAEVQP